MVWQTGGQARALLASPAGRRGFETAVEAGRQLFGFTATAMQDSNEENNILRAACIKRFDLFTDLLSRNCRYLVETSGLIKI